MPLARNNRVAVNGHAVERARQRVVGLKGSTNDQIRTVLRGMAKQGHTMLSQEGGERVVYSQSHHDDGEYVLILVPIGVKNWSVKTVLTHRQFRVNCERRAFRNRNRRRP